jgi:hypothetical protein
MYICIDTCIERRHIIQIQIYKGIAIYIYIYIYIFICTQKYHPKSLRCAWGPFTASYTACSVDCVCASASQRPIGDAPAITRYLDTIIPGGEGEKGGVRGGGGEGVQNEWEMCVCVWGGGEVG